MTNLNKLPRLLILGLSLFPSSYAFAEKSPITDGARGVFTRIIGADAAENIKLGTLPKVDGRDTYVYGAKDGKLAFVHAEESTFLWAKAMGYKGERLLKPTSTSGNMESFRYLDGDVIHCKANNAGHGATHEINEEALLKFLRDRNM